VVPIQPTPFRTPPQVLPDDREHLSVRDMHSQPVAQQLVLNRGIIRLDIGLQDEARPWCWWRRPVDFPGLPSTPSYRWGRLP
jgi:hypothetical protein